MRSMLKRSLCSLLGMSRLLKPINSLFTYVMERRMKKWDERFDSVNQWSIRVAASDVQYCCSICNEGKLKIRPRAIDGMAKKDETRVSSLEKRTQQSGAAYYEHDAFSVLYYFGRCRWHTSMLFSLASNAQRFSDDQERALSTRISAPF